MCPFHSLLLPLIGESQPCADWCFLLPFAPQSDLLKSPTADSSNPIKPSSVLLSRLADLCKTSVAIAERVTMTPVNEILAVVPKMTLWASCPASGEVNLPDLAYLPQEYITQVKTITLIIINETVSRLFHLRQRHFCLLPRMKKDLFWIVTCKTTYAI